MSEQDEQARVGEETKEQQVKVGEETKEQQAEEKEYVHSDASAFLGRN